MKKITTALAILFIASHFKFNAQVSSYQFFQSPQFYGSTGLGSKIGGNLQDDDLNAIAIPFPFKFNGITQTSVNVSSNGYLAFNSSIANFYNPVSDLSSQDIISAFGADLVMGHIIKADVTAGSNILTNVSSIGNLNIGDSLFDYLNTFASSPVIITAINGNTVTLSVNSTTSIVSYDAVFLNGAIRKNVSGVSPNQILEIEYKNFSRFGVNDESISFKVRLFETTNAIEVLYGIITVGNSPFSIDQVEVGLKGPNNQDFNSRKVDNANPWSGSASATLITDFCDFNSFNFPSFGESYLWTPVGCTPPALTIQQSDFSICSGKTITLTALGATSYTWSNGSHASQIVVSPTTTTLYNLIGVVNSCAATASVLMNVAQTPTLSTTQTKSSICKGQTSTLTVSGATTYSWNNGAIGATVIITPTVTTNYTVTGKNGNCSSSKTVLQVVSLCTGISEEGETRDDVNAYPNPFKNSLTIKNSGLEETTVTIMDALGREVYTMVLSSQIAQVINTESFNSGFYVMSIGKGSNRIIKKLIKN